MTNSEKAVDKFKEGYNCAQSVMFGLMDYTSLSEEESLRMTTGFGAGMGRTQHVCGAISGAIVALNMIYSPDSRDKIYSSIQQLMREFENQNGSVECKELLHGCDLLSPAGQEKFQSENMINQCYSYVYSVVEIMEYLLSNESQ